MSKEARFCFFLPPPFSPLIILRFLVLAGVDPMLSATDGARPKRKKKKRLLDGRGKANVSLQYPRVKAINRPNKGFNGCVTRLITAQVLNSTKATKKQ